MSNQKAVNKIFEDLKKILSKYPGGALIEDIELALVKNISRRALQRRLLKLQQMKQVRVEGKTRATKYFLISETNEQSFITEVTETGIPLSKEGKHLLRQVNRPLQQRKPVSYHRDFLENYQPNITYYLSLEERENLARMGKSIMSDQPAGTYAKEILNRLLIDLSWNSSRLEGNTYSLLDSQRLIELGEMVDDKSRTEAQMILNHKDAIEFLVQSAEEIDFNRYTILNLHAFLSLNLLSDPRASGRLRKFSVGIYQSVYEPLAIPQLISELFDLILEKAKKIQDPFEQAFFVMVHLPYLQPFDDVNKRVSRLAVNIPLFRYNLAPLSFVDVAKDIYIQGIIAIYELNRIELFKDVFLWAYERSAARYAVLRQSLGDADPFQFKYRKEISMLIAKIVSEPLNPKQASALIQLTAKQLLEQDQEKFIEVIDMAILSLHEGNFARYRIQPSDFKRWQILWLPNLSRSEK